MKNRVVLVAFQFALGALPAWSAYAETIWNGLQSGATVDQVRSSYPDLVPYVPKTGEKLGPGKSYLVRQTVVAGSTCRQSFGFAENGLRSVSTTCSNLTEDEASQISAGLTSKYGSPAKRTVTDLLAILEWEKNSDHGQITQMIFGVVKPALFYRGPSAYNVDIFYSSEAPDTSGL